MKVYAIKGESQQNVLSESITKKKAGLGSKHMLMETERPTSEHVAADGGVWELAGISAELETL